MSDPNAGKIVRLEIDNVKRLKAVRITPSGELVVVAGKNDQGKSSVLDAIRFALGGPSAMKDTPEVVRRGEIAAKVVAEFEDLIVTRTVLDGRQAVVVVGKDGGRFSSPQSMLDRLLGSLTFDPLAFAKLRPADQRKILLGLVDLGIDLDALDRKRATAYEDRTVIGRDRDAITGSLQTAPDYARDESLPTEERSATELIDTLEKARLHNGWHGRRNQVLEDSRQDLDLIDAEVARLKAAMNEQQNLKAKTLTRISETEAEIAAAHPPVDLQPFRDDLDNLELTNVKVRERQRFLKLTADYRRVAEGYDRLTAEIAEIDATKSKALAEATMPVHGLSFDDESVLFDGIPLSQASESQRVKTSAAIQMALNPSIRVMLIDNGNALDADNLTVLEQMAAENDYQIWMTWVGDSERAQLVIEDGEVK